MHELSVAMALVGQARAVLAENPGMRARRLTVEVGPYSGVDPEALRFAFPAAAADTPLAGSEVVVEEVSAAGTCPGCGWRGEPEIPFLACPGCGGLITLERGGEMILKSMEINGDV